ncbi:uncharacterized protein [Lepeophtheirus salmonis]|uniref:uncharacterized protein isoform X2 n=2 Tax=Lepeophtheirus salmonis TaxID=72036 RepID=UPI001AE57BB4|nr:uncharacterized protein LOC121132459 isoform X3 [Lepeophtheirus salmonis]
MIAASIFQGRLLTLSRVTLSLSKPILIINMSDSTSTTPRIPNWDLRYSEKEYAFGEGPNLFFKSELEKLTSGKLLLPAEGEGRNGVFAAKIGWDVIAFDKSVQGKVKAEALAQSQGVSLKYNICDIAEVSYENDQFDALGFIYLHFPKEDKKKNYQRLFPFLKKGGYVIAEMFSDKHLPYREKNPNVGGPHNFEFLFSRAEIEDIFEGFEILFLKEEIVDLKEGKYHNGTGSVFRLLALKK